MCLPWGNFPVAIGRLIYYMPQTAGVASFRLGDGGAAPRSSAINTRLTAAEVLSNRGILGETDAAAFRSAYSAWFAGFKRRPDRHPDLLLLPTHRAAVLCPA